MSGLKKEKSVDSELRSYQKATLFLFYPYLLSFMSSFIGFYNTQYDYPLALGAVRLISCFFRDNPVDGNAALSVFFLIVINLAVSGIGLLFSLKAAKGKLWALVAASALYLADFVYSALLINQNLLYPVGNITYIILMAVHAIWCLSYIYLFYKYAKLTRLLKNEKA